MLNLVDSFSGRWVRMVFSGRWGLLLYEAHLVVYMIGLRELLGLLGGMAWGILYSLLLVDVLAHLLHGSLDYGLSQQECSSKFVY
ncbi:hypothetical protein VNO78_19398 [Psophocarpus tetragonolobus]|uniref:Uncharacterized protein n=1 Tax=Psophocarpus tetragonolobus TaxID=3891 RepID=A0AAN9S851_PSOTE